MTEGDRPTTILEGLSRMATRGGKGYVFYLNEGKDHMSLDRLHEGAWARARVLLARGVQPGDAVGILGPNFPDWIQWAVAIWMVGGALNPVEIGRAHV